MATASRIWRWQISYPNTVSILLGNGNGTFREAPGSPIAVGANPDSVAVGDFNSDGIADLAVTNSGATTVSILLGDGSGGFTEVRASSRGRQSFPEAWPWGTSMGMALQIWRLQIKVLIL